jgi:dTDP-4-amino-4,6-dideoxy-D-glucose acyltransferase
MTFLNSEQLSAIGFRTVGRDVKISDKAAFYGAERISVGSHTRIDDFCVVSAGEGGIKLGSYVHLAVGCTLMGAGEIVFEDFSGMSAGGKIYSSSDDYSGEFLTNPTVPAKYRNVSTGPVRIGTHVIIGAGCVILPGVTIGAGSAVGALSLVTRDIAPGLIMAGSPARQVGERSAKVFELEMRLRDESLP